MSDLSSRDFLHQHAKTPLCDQFLAAGALCRFSTNSESVLEAARATFSRPHDPENAMRTAFSLRVWIDETDRAEPPWPKPYVRGLDHLVYAGFDSKSSLLADVATRQVIGRFSSAMAQDLSYWKMTIFPMLMTILAGSLGVLELHASCVARHQDGLLLLGPGRAGKSTLALALSQCGFRVLSDDRTFCSADDGGVFAYGFPRPLKIRRDAAQWFEQFRSLQPLHFQNGEPVFYSDCGEAQELQHRQPCEPKALIFLARQEGESCRITRVRRSEARSRIEAELLPEDPEAFVRQKQVLDRLLDVPCWDLHYGVEPHAVAEQVQRLLPIKP
jgi:hypothetical protein